METNKQPLTDKKMNSDRIKQIQETMTAYPNSQGVMLALKQVWNECAQETKPLKEEIEKRKKDLALIREALKVDFNSEVLAKIAELEYSLSLAKKENEELTKINQWQWDKFFEGWPNRIRKYRDEIKRWKKDHEEQHAGMVKLVDKLTSVKEQHEIDINSHRLNYRDCNNELLVLQNKGKDLVNTLKKLASSGRLSLTQHQLIEEALTNYKQTKP